jgi:acyl dehydratase
MQCIVRYYRQEARRLLKAGKPVPLLGPAAGVKHMRWHAPVRAGEIITFSTWAERKMVIASHGEWGLLIAGAEGIDPRGEVVVSFYPQLLLQRLPHQAT